MESIIDPFTLKEYKMCSPELLEQARLMLEEEKAKDTRNHYEFDLTEYNNWIWNFS